MGAGDRSDPVRLEVPNSGAYLLIMIPSLSYRLGPGKRAGLARVGLGLDPHSTPPQHLVLAPLGTLLPLWPPSLLSQQLDLDLWNRKVDSRGAFSESQC